MAIKISNAVRSEMAKQIIAAIDGTANKKGKIKMYSGTRPTSPETNATTSEKILSEHELSNPCATEANGVITFSAIGECPAALESGTCTWARIFDGNDKAIADVSVSAVGANGDLQMNTTEIVKGGPIRFTSVVWTLPG